MEWGTSPTHKPWLVPPLGLKADRGSGTFPDELDAHVALLTAAASYTSVNRGGWRKIDLPTRAKKTCCFSEP